MSELPRIGVRAYSRHRGCTHHAVQKAITRGRLTEETATNPAGSFTRNAKGHPQINPERADAEWDSNTDESQQRENHRKAEPKPSAAGGLFPDTEGAGTEPAAPPATNGDAPRRPTLASAQAVRTTYLAQIAKLEYEERLGSLIRADGVKVEQFRVARQVRDKILGIPDRLAAELATISDTHELRERLALELREALEKLADALG